jgi:HlyD family secretion protein
MKRLLPLLLLVALAAIGIYVYTRPPAELVLTGVVTTNDVVVSPLVGGRIEELLVKEGDLVTRGQLLAVLAPDELRAESDYAARTVDNVTSQVEQAQAAVRWEEQQTAEQIHRAESTLAATESQHRAAVVDLESAKRTLARTENLHRDGVVSLQALEDARTATDAAEAKVAALAQQADAERAAVMLARSNAEQVTIRRSQVQSNRSLQAAAAAQQARADVRLAYTRVTAPTAGIVDVRAARPGEVVAAGQPIVTLVDPDDLWVRVDVEETYIDRIKPNDRLTVRLPSGAELQGVVFHRGVDAGFATQRDVSRTKRDIKTFEIRLRCDNADRRLAVGMTAYVIVPIAKFFSHAGD